MASRATFIVYFSMISNILLPLYVPQLAQARWGCLNSLHSGHWPRFGVCPFQLALLLSLLALECLCVGFANLSSFHFSKKFLSASSLGSISFLSQSHCPAFRSVPHFGQMPLQSSLQRGFICSFRSTCSFSSSRRSSSSPS